MSKVTIEQEDETVRITLSNSSEEEADAAFDALTRQLSQGRIIIEILPDPCRISTIADSDGDDGA